MQRHTRSTVLRAAALIATLPLLSGCIVWDIRRELEASNETVARVESRLDEVERTNELLVDMQERVAVLESIDASLKRLDEHLASLRETIDNIDSTIPFLSISGDGDEEETADPSDSATDPDDPAAPTTDPGGGESGGGGEGGDGEAAA